MSNDLNKKLKEFDSRIKKLTASKQALEEKKRAAVAKYDEEIVALTAEISDCNLNKSKIEKMLRNIESMLSSFDTQDRAKQKAKEEKPVEEAVKEEPVQSAVEEEVELEAVPAEEPANEPVADEIADSASKEFESEPGEAAEPEKPEKQSSFGFHW